MERFSIIIGGDLVPTPSNYNLFSKSGFEALADTSLQKVLFGADYRIYNLETPLCNQETPIDKCGPNLIAPTSTMAGLKAFRPSLFTLANNHILDQGEAGLLTTMDLLSKNNIPCIGAGKNLSEAAAPYIINKNGLKIGIYACTEHEFTIAETHHAGANPFEPLESPDHIQHLKSNCDYVIVIYHGGKEHYRYPTPYLQKVCRKICDKGADLVLCQHSHCIGCEEKYNESVIVYGQGNFLFDYSESEYWETSLLVLVDFADSVKVSYLPICKDGRGVRMAKKEESDAIFQAFYQRSSEILEDGFIAERYKAFALENKAYYLFTLAGQDAVCKYPYSNDFSPPYAKSTLLEIMNYMRCEPHNELIFTVISEMAKESKV